MSRNHMFENHFKDNDEQMSYVKKSDLNHYVVYRKISAVLQSKKTVINKTFVDGLKTGLKLFL